MAALDYENTQPCSQCHKLLIHRIAVRLAFQRRHCTDHVIGHVLPLCKHRIICKEDLSFQILPQSSACHGVETTVSVGRSEWWWVLTIKSSLFDWVSLACVWDAYRVIRCVRVIIHTNHAIAIRVHQLEVCGGDIFGHICSIGVGVAPPSIHSPKHEWATANLEQHSEQPSDKALKGWNFCSSALGCCRLSGWGQAGVCWKQGVESMKECLQCGKIKGCKSNGLKA